MGARGPAPKRSSERRRRNKDSKPQKVTVTGGRVRPPRVSNHWHPIAKQWFTSLRQSGQSEFYEPSDWQAARYVAEVMSRHLKEKKPSAVLFASLWSAMTDLLSTESSRRRVRLELERVPGDGDTGKVAELDAYRKRVGA